MNTKPAIDPTCTIIQNEEQLERFFKNNSEVPWISFDTEFIPPKKLYKSKLCLIQIASPNGTYLIDCLKVKNLTLFNSILTNQKILKITHAGKHDYEILKDKYSVLPKNTFDTQLACAFLGPSSRIGLGKLISHELGIEIDKELALSDWEKRPLSSEQIRYALNDVLYLKKLKDSLLLKLKEANRLKWAWEECRRLEDPEYYISDILDTLLGINWSSDLSGEGITLLIKLLEWRKNEAKRKNMPEDWVLKLKDIYKIITSLLNGTSLKPESLVLSPKLVKRYLPEFEKIYTKITDHDINVASKLVPRNYTGPRFQLLIDFLWLFIRYRSLQNNLDPNFVCSRKDLKRIYWAGDFERSFLFKGWRNKLLCNSFKQWLSEASQITINFDEELFSFVIDKSNEILDTNASKQNGQNTPPI